MIIPMWAPFLLLCLVCLLPSRCKCRKGAKCDACMERDGLTKGKQ